MTSSYVPGLQGVVAAQTRLSSVNGDGELIIAGYALEQLAGRIGARGRRWDQGSSG